MSVNLYTFVDMYSRQLATAAHLLDKGLERAAELGVGEAEMLSWRLIEDMNPLSFQLAVVANFAQQWPARAAGLELPAEVAHDLDAAGLKAAIAQAKAYLAGLTPEQFAGRDEVPLTFTIGGDMKPTLPTGQWLSVFATTNLYFHLSTAYAILRAHGTKIGKVDLFAAGL
ncbi:DUF1993 family protein [Phenylobacterium sp.]|uniref:DUF1993 family protein n=1 Tax=Phenylobacterium sp. TaxID=1871053 RepID=UPI0035ADB652